MSAQEWTRGPWRVEPHKAARGNWIISPKGEYVALVCMIEGSEQEEDANANLVAAATEMFDAVKQAALELQEAANCLRPTFPSLADIYDKAVQAKYEVLAKATGDRS